MLSLPSKPWKRVRIDALGGDEYRLTFISPIADEAEFRETIEDDIGASLGPNDKLGAADWATKSVTLTTVDLAGLKRKLVYASVMIEA